VTCPDPIRLVAASAGEDVAASAHATACPACRRAMRDHLALRELARALPAPALDREHADELGAALLARAEAVTVDPPVVPPPIPVAGRPDPLIPSMRSPGASARRGTDGRRHVIAVAVATAALAAAVAVIAIVHPDPPERALPVVSAPPGDREPETAVAYLDVPAPAPAGRARPAAADVIASAGARFERSEAGAVDRIVLRDGALTIDVAPASPPIAIVGTNVTVRATRARLATRGDAGVIRHVRVLAGTAEIEDGSAVIAVVAGETWTWDEPAAVAAAADPAAERAGPPAGSPDDPMAAFTAATDARKAGAHARAAALFERAAADATIAEEATFMAAVAWDAAGDAGRARAAYRRFLDRFPESRTAAAARTALDRLPAPAPEPE
jgi:hypothetical protein